MAGAVPRQQGHNGTDGPLNQCGAKAASEALGGVRPAQWYLQADSSAQWWRSGCIPEHGHVLHSGEAFSTHKSC